MFKVTLPICRIEQYVKNQQKRLKLQDFSPELSKVGSGSLGPPVENRLSQELVDKELLEAPVKELQEDSWTWSTSELERDPPSDPGVIPDSSEQDPPSGIGQSFDTLGTDPCSLALLASLMQRQFEKQQKFTPGFVFLESKTSTEKKSSKT